MLLLNVALGKVFDTGKIDSKIKKAPNGFDSIHGDPSFKNSEFADNEYCIYRQSQLHMAYFVEF